MSQHSRRSFLAAAAMAAGTAAMASGSTVSVKPRAGVRSGARPTRVRAGQAIRMGVIGPGGMGSE
ncbi:MAG TPA: hypothetical protein VFF69_04270, partial [Phycisphaerales bacterium]|nr:hypothetical protein [Phycisphaerales bacterium]